jgi:hypothetical protein
MGHNRVAGMDARGVEADHRRRLFADDAAQRMDPLAVAERTFDVVLMHPPFGDASSRGKREFERAYPQNRNDVYAAFVERDIELLSSGCRLGPITSQMRFLLSRFQESREEILLSDAAPAVFAVLSGGVLDSAMVDTAPSCFEART